MKLFANAIALLWISTAMMQAQSASGLNLQRTISLPGVHGKFDHFAMDESGKRLFAAATGNQSVEVIDLTTDKVVESLRGLGKPHGLVWLPKAGYLFVADGGKSELDVFAGSPLKRIKTIPLSEDADDMVYDISTNLLYVGHGGTNTANPARIAVIDAGTLSIVSELSVASHPEALELDPNGDRIFANIADSGQVVVIDGKTHTIVSTWSLKDETGNTPMAYDATDHLLLIGCRTPAKLVVLNGKTGAEISLATSSTGADDLFYEPAAHRGYLISGSGAIDTFSISPEGKLQPLAATHTVTGAKTGLLSAGQHLLYIGIPGTTEPAAIRVYQIPAK